MQLLSRNGARLEAVRDPRSNPLLCDDHPAAFELEILAGRSDDTDVSWVLGRLARDITSHAEFGWALCTWMLRRWPALRDHARGSFSAASGRAPTGLRGVLPRLGLLSPSERRELLQRAQADTVDVAASRLLGSAATARHIETWLEARRRPIELAE